MIRRLKNDGIAFRFCDVAIHALAGAIVFLTTMELKFKMQQQVGSNVEYIEQLLSAYRTVAR